MYLQSLEMFGFKSFAPRTILNFHRGVTAVVGPNGCGKSNVLDAIRWVLGEQSAKALRGGEMADVIFSGTDSRQALGMAEVSLTFAECEKELGVDWNEVCITRRVFRDGKSEYFLNKTPCRLRDIHQLFMDTGMGRSAYSIMEQGKIDLILEQPAGRPARDFRGSRGHHEIQGAEEGGAAETRVHRGEPAAGSGYHQGGPPADRLAPASGGQGAALSGFDERPQDLRYASFAQKLPASFRSNREEIRRELAHGEEAAGNP